MPNHTTPGTVSTATLFARCMKQVSAGAVIFNNQGEVLLVHHTYGVKNWEVPGGGGEPNESPDETAVREVFEETTLRVRAVAATGWYYDETVDKMGGVFLCEVVGGTIEPDGREISECRYWPVDDLPRPMSDWTELRIRDAVSGTRLPIPTRIRARVWLE